jgi:hypothetical protein
VSVHVHPEILEKKLFKNFKKLQIGIFTFFAGLQNSPKNVFQSFMTKIDVNQPKEQKKNPRKWVF